MLYPVGQDRIKGGGSYGITPPEMLTSTILKIISAYLCSCSCQYCYHIKQNYCIFSSPKAFCDTEKSAEKAYAAEAPPRPGWGSLRRSPRCPSRLARGTPPHQSPPPLTTFASWYRPAPEAPHFSEPLRNFFLLWGQCIINGDFVIVVHGPLSA